MIVRPKPRLINFALIFFFQIPEFRPLIRLFAIDSMENVVAIQNWTAIGANPAFKGSKARFLAKNKRQLPAPSSQQESTASQSVPAQQTQSPTALYQSVTFVGNELYAIRKEAQQAGSTSSSSSGGNNGGGNSPLFLVKLDINQVDQVVYKVSCDGEISIL